MHAGFGEASTTVFPGFTREGNYQFLLLFS